MMNTASTEVALGKIDIFFKSSMIKKGWATLLDDAF